MTKQQQTTRAPTLREVAKAAKVSVMTVSNVVNRRFHLMSPETRSRVERAITRLNYRRHESARSLRLAKRFSIAMIIVDPSPTFLADPFITNLLAGLTNQLGESGYSLILHGCAPDALEEALCLRQKGTDGQCIMLSGSPDVRDRCLGLVARLAQPLVVVQEPVALADSDICTVRQDDYGGAAELARHVLSRGARNLLLLVPALPWPAIEERERGIRSVMTAAARLSVLPCGSGNYAETQAAFSRYVERFGMPDAVLAGNDQMGIAAMKWLAAHGLRVPADVRVTGFNAFDFWQYSEPVLTTVRSPAYELGQRGGQELIDRLMTGRFATREIVFPVTLQIGASC